MSEREELEAVKVLASELFIDQYSAHKDWETAKDMAENFDTDAFVERIAKALSALPNDEPNADVNRLTEAASGGDAGQYLLLKRGLYWRPNCAGYTPLKSEAGRYSLEEASSRATSRHIRDKYEGPHVYMIAEARADQLAERCEHADFTEPTPPAARSESEDTQAKATHTQDDVDALVEAGQEFVKKVETGEARSKRSYAQFKAALTPFQKG